MIIVCLVFLFLLCHGIQDHAGASFISTPSSDIYFTPPNSITLKWAFDESLHPYTISFGKLDSSSGAYDVYVEHIFQGKTTIVHWQKSRIDMYEQATLRINHTSRADAGKYKCQLNTASGGFESVVNVWASAIQPTSSNVKEMSPTRPKLSIEKSYLTRKSCSSATVTIIKSDGPLLFITANLNENDQVRTSKIQHSSSRMEKGTTLLASSAYLRREEVHAASILKRKDIIKPSPSSCLEGHHSFSNRDLHLEKCSETSKEEGNVSKYNVVLGLGLGLPLSIIIIIFFVYLYSVKKKQQIRHFQKQDTSEIKFHKSASNLATMIDIKRASITEFS